MVMPSLKGNVFKMCWFMKESSVRVSPKGFTFICFSKRKAASFHAQRALPASRPLLFHRFPVSQQIFNLWSLVVWLDHL